MHPDAFFVGLTAVALRELPLPTGFDPEAPLSVAMPSPGRAPRVAGIDGHRVSARLVIGQEHRGLRVTAPADLWASLGGVLSERELIILGDAIVRVPRDRFGEHQPDERLATIAELESSARRPRRRHRDALLRALQRVRVGSMSALETDYRLAADDDGLPEPELDLDVLDASGRRIGIGDVCYRRWGVIVEIEGRHHGTSNAQWDRDLDKYAAYAEAGVELVRLGSKQVRGHQARGPAIVRAVLRRRGWQPPETSSTG